MKNYRITVNGTSYDVSVEELAGGVAPVAAPVAAAPVAAPAAAPAPAPAAKSAGAGSIQGASPMPGKILDVKANVGDAVKKGQLTEERIDQSLTRIYKVKFASKVAGY